MKTIQQVIEIDGNLVTEFKTSKITNKMDQHKRAILNLRKSIRMHLIKANRELEKWGSAAGSAIRN